MYGLEAGRPDRGIRVPVRGGPIRSRTPARGGESSQLPMSVPSVPPLAFLPSVRFAMQSARTRFVRRFNANRRLAKRTEGLEIMPPSPLPSGRPA